MRHWKIAPISIAVLMLSAGCGGVTASEDLGAKDGAQKNEASIPDRGPDANGPGDLDAGSEGGAGDGPYDASDASDASDATDATDATNLCGNNLIDSGEACDGLNLGQQTCKKQGFDGGTLKCQTDCSALDPSGCYKCGDNQLNPGEACDGTNLNNKTCKDMGFDGGSLACDSKCLYSTTKCYRCGDGVVDPGETCDGANLNNKTCKTMGYAAGTLACNKCLLDTSGCTQCGNGKLDPGEQCDGKALAGKTCQGLGFDGGVLGCDNKCKLDASGCTKITCGNGKIEKGEQCEGSNLGGKDCKALGHDGGALECNSQNCQLDLAKCYKCGDGQINFGENCDGKNLAGLTCLTLGFDGGKLACSSSCAFDKAACHKCGDAKKNGTEQCDKADLGGKSCKSEGFYLGTLACKGGCTLDTSQCTSCGNAKLDSNEDCDGASLGGKTCKDLKFFAGTLKCGSNCKFDTAGCTNAGCGNGKLDGGEACEGTDLGGKTCKGLGYAGGTLSCAKNCTLVASACYKCGDAKKNGSEACDGTDLAGKQCKDLSPFHSGTLACKIDCSGFDTAACNRCGDGTVNGTEKCDGTQLVGKTCKDLGFDGGTLSCKACAFDVGMCHKCGNGKLDGSETCDGAQLGGATCVKQGFDGGALACSSSCTLVSSGCIKHTWKTIPAGAFQMGAPASELCRLGSPYKEKETQHWVSLSNAFEIPDSEVTQAQFNAVLGYNPSKYSSCGTSCPVEQVSWHEAAAYSNALSAARGLTSCYTCTGSGTGVTCAEAAAHAGSKIYSCPGYRLPTEAEWEHAARAGTTTALFNGNLTNCSNDSKASAVGWYTSNSNNQTHPVKQKPANAWGLYDTAGNVAEWTGDWSLEDPGSAGVANPIGAAKGTMLRIKGGSFETSASWIRPAARIAKELPTAKDRRLGFRPVRSLPCNKTSCADGKQNGCETDVDCGGGFCAGCKDSKKCRLESDCLSGVCSGGACKAGCVHQPVVKSCSTDGTLGLTLCKVPSGCFTMGSPANESCRETDESQHQVTLTRSIEIQSTEVTQGSFKAAMGSAPFFLTSCGTDCPVDAVKWHEAAAYCNTLSKKKGLATCYACTGVGSSTACKETAAYSSATGKKIMDCPGYRLPVEAEWEYAYRAGTTTAYYNGDNISAACTAQSPKDPNADAIAWHFDNSAVTYSGCQDLSFYGGPKCTGIHPVGKKLANAWGLYDMAGNVDEWCHDLFKADLGLKAVTDPVSNGTGGFVLRGGSWPWSEGYHRAASRRGTSGANHIGFRCVRSLN